MAKLYFTYSAMNAGKSSSLLQAAYNYRERGMEVMLWTSSHHGKRPGDQTGDISSRIGLGHSARLFYPGTRLWQEIEQENRNRKLGAVFVDEAQFLTSDQVWQLARVADALGVPVLCYGLRTDFQGKTFEGSAVLLAIADNLREARTICHCGRKATMTARLQPDGSAVTAGDQVAVEKSSYVSLCRKHWLEAVKS